MSESSRNTAANSAMQIFLQEILVFLRNIDEWYGICERINEALLLTLIFHASHVGQLLQADKMVTLIQNNTNNEKMKVKDKSNCLLYEQMTAYNFPQGTRKYSALHDMTSNGQQHLIPIIISKINTILF